MKKQLKYVFGAAFALLLLTSCNEFLDREPVSNIPPEAYLNEESQLAAYITRQYPDILPSHGRWSYGVFAEDRGTDNMAIANLNTRWVPGQTRVPQSGGDWSFTMIYKCNYFMEDVLPKWREGAIEGNAENIDHHIGEMYFLRAFEYFKKLQNVGDFPIVRRTYPDEIGILTEISKRAPRNEVARFIISDLDSAAVLLREVAPDGRKNRISRDCAILMKSRVALFEGTFLKNFKDTPFVPNGPGWPGKEKDYNAGYAYPTGDIDKEIDYFLSLCMASAKEIADRIELTPNNQVLQQDASDPVNPYFNMFGVEDMSPYAEVLMWRQYDRAYNILNSVSFAASMGNYLAGTTRGMVDGFLMKNGLPIYAPGSGYAGDDYISDVRIDRDNRLELFLKEPGQINVVYNTDGNVNRREEYVPALLSTNDDKYTTGYALRKGGSFDGAIGGSSDNGTTGSITFRAVEAHLNYIEACYEKNGYLDGDAQRYWVMVRERGGVDADYQKTIANTNVALEAANDWGAYTAGVYVDATLYNIRRERRCELMAEGFRWMDLRRWRALDQMIDTPCHIEGFKLWGPMQDWYLDDDGKTTLIYGKDNHLSNVSDPALSPYLRPYSILGTSLAFDGYRWMMGQYLSPIAMGHFLITSNGNDVATSPIYQNPYWLTEANTAPVQ